MTKLEKEACRRIAAAIRDYAQIKETSLNKVAKEWGVHPATLDTLVGSGVRPAAANIPRGSTLQTIAQKTRRSLDWLLALVDEPEFVDQTRAIATLENDVAAHVKRIVDAQLGPPRSVLGEREEWVVYGQNALQLAVDHTLLQAKAIENPAVQRTAILAVMIREKVKA